MRKARKTDTVLPLDQSIGQLSTIATNLMQREMGRRLAEHGIPLGCWWYLRLLWEQERESQREMSKHVGFTDASAGTAIRNLEKLGLAKRIRDQTDTRKIKVLLTDRGHSLRAKLLPIALEIHNRALNGFSTAERKDLLAKMTKVIENLRE